MAHVTNADIAKFLITKGVRSDKACGHDFEWAYADLRERTGNPLKELGFRSPGTRCFLSESRQEKIYEIMQVTEPAIEPVPDPLTPKQVERREFLTNDKTLSLLELRAMVDSAITKHGEDARVTTMDNDWCASKPSIKDSYTFRNTGDCEDNCFWASKPSRYPAHSLFNWLVVA